MPSDSLEALADIIQTLIHFAARPLVQAQLAAFLIAVLSAWIVTGLLWKVLGQRFERWAYMTPQGSDDDAAEETGLNEDGLLTFDNEHQIHPRYLWQRVAILLQRLLFPLLGLVFIRISGNYFESLGTVSGLLNECVLIFWIFAAYRLFITMLYIIFPKRHVERYHHRIIVPLFAIWAAARLLNLMFNLPALYQLQLFTIFGTTITLGALIITPLGLYIWIGVVTALRDSLKSFAYARNSSEAGLADAWLTISGYILYFIGFLAVFNVLGLDANTLAFITGGLSVGIGFSLRSVLGNFLSGLILLFERSLKPGDVIEVDGLMAVVNRLQIRATTVQTLDGIEVIIPNESLLTSNVTTYTGSHRRVRISVNVGISYKNEPRRARAILLDLAKEHPKVLDHPLPQCFVTGFGDSSIDLSLKVWVIMDSPATLFNLRTELSDQIWDSFAEHDIEIPYPQRDLHVRSGLEAEAKAEKTLTEIS